MNNSPAAPTRVSRPEHDLKTHPRARRPHFAWAVVLGLAVTSLGCRTAQPNAIPQPAGIEPAAATADSLDELCFTPSPIPIIRIDSPYPLPPVSRDKIEADFYFFDEPNGDGWYDPAGPHQKGHGKIHARGQSSLGFPKKSFAINLGKENAIPIMGMDPSHKWVMIGNWVDTTHLANKMSYDLYAAMGHYGPESRYVQVCFNNQYWGLYTFGERVNRGEGRVQTPKAKNGGFIVKEVDSGPHFCSETDREFQYEYPDIEDITEEQKKNIRDFIDNYETTVMERGDWRSLMNEAAEIDYFLIVEAFTNPDSYFNDKNLFYFKNDDDELEPVIWDFIWAFGPPFFVNQGNNPGIWPSIDRGTALMYGNTNYQYRVGYNQFCLMKYYMSDAEQLQDFQERYAELRGGLLSNKAILDRWSAAVEPLNVRIPGPERSVYTLDEERWNGWSDAAHPYWPTERFSPDTFRDLLIERLELLDTKIPALQFQALQDSCPLNPPRWSCPP